MRPARVARLPRVPPGSSVSPVAVCLALSALLVVLVGCGNSAGSAVDENVPTRQVVDANGDTVIVPVNPRGVLALGENDIDASLALGVPVVGTLKGRGQDGPPRYLAERAREIPTVGELTKPDADAITRLIVDGKADLILVSGLSDPKVIDGLREKGVPVVVTATGTEQDWKVSFNRIAEAVGKQPRAEQVLGAYAAKVAEVKGALGPRASDTVSIARWNAKGPGVVENDRFASLVIGDLGLSRPPAQQRATGQGGNTTLSLEQLAKIDADWLFVGSLSAADQQAFAQAKNLPQYQALNVVKADHVVEVDGTKWTSRGGPIAANGVLDDVRNALAAA